MFFLNSRRSLEEKTVIRSELVFYFRKFLRDIELSIQNFVQCYLKFIRFKIFR